jgi:hypothetical protein
MKVFSYKDYIYFYSAEFIFTEQQQHKQQQQQQQQQRSNNNNE